MAGKWIIIIWFFIITWPGDDDDDSLVAVWELLRKLYKYKYLFNEQLRYVVITIIILNTTQFLQLLLSRVRLSATLYMPRPERLKKKINI